MTCQPPVSSTSKDEELSKNIVDMLLSLLSQGFMASKLLTGWSRRRSGWELRRAGRGARRGWRAPPPPSASLSPDKKIHDLIRYEQNFNVLYQALNYCGRSNFNLENYVCFVSDPWQATGPAVLWATLALYCQRVGNSPAKQNILLSQQAWNVLKPQEEFCWRFLLKFCHCSHSYFC